MTSSSVLRLGALHANFQGGFWNSDHDYLIAFHSKYLSRIHGFRDWVVFSSRLWRHRDFSVRGHCTQFFDCRFCKGDPDFILVLHRNYTSIVYRFHVCRKWCHSDFVTRGASGNFWLRILKGQPRIYIHVQLTLFVYLEWFRRYSTFLFGWDFPTGSKFWEVLGQNDLQNVKWEKTLAGRALPYAKLRLLSHCA